MLNRAMSARVSSNDIALARARELREGDAV